MAKPARTAVDRDKYLPFADAEGTGGLFIIDLLDHLYFKVVVPRTQRSHLIKLPLFGQIGDEVGLGIFHTAVLFDKRQVLL